MRPWVCVQAKMGRDRELKAELLDAGFRLVVTPEARFYKRLNARQRKKQGKSKICNIRLVCPGYVFLQTMQERFVLTADLAEAEGLVENAHNVLIPHEQVIRFLDSCDRVLYPDETNLEEHEHTKRLTAPAADPKLVGMSAMFYSGKQMLAGEITATADREVEITVGQTIYKCLPELLLQVA